ncbi:MAG: hypothetical protein ACK5HA_07955 [Planctomycetaceae bacterium]|jgi:hypothetical protein
MPRLPLSLPGGFALACAVGCASAARQPTPHYTHHPRPDGRYSYVDVKRYTPQQVAQLPPGSRCTVETVGGERSVTGFVQTASADGVVLVNAEEIVPRSEVPSNLKGDGYSHTPRAEVRIPAAEIAQVRVFQK